MRTSVRAAGVVFIGAAAFLLFGVATASATVPDITDPARIQDKTYLPAQQPATPSAEEQPPPPEAAPVTEPALEEPGAPATEVVPEEAAAVGAEADPIPVETLALPATQATPAPEQVLTTSSRPVVSAADDGSEAGTPTVSTANGLKNGFNAFGARIAETLSTACQGAAAMGAGGPALVVVAVLGLGAAVMRNGILRSWSVGDEDLREFLYAWDVIAPG